MTELPASDIVREAERILDGASERSLPVRLLGGLAIRFHANGEMREAVVREYRDIDLVSLSPAAEGVARLLAELGYEENVRFNTLNAGRRAVFYPTHDRWKVDLFIGGFEMCHSIPIARRLGLDAKTIPLAELLLTKLQIVQLNEKDVRDVVALLLDHDVGERDEETINAVYIAKLCGTDWGLWRTCKETIRLTKAGVRDLDLTPIERERIENRLEALWDRIEREPKSRRWRLRDRVGERVRWYLEPEETE